MRVEGGIVTVEVLPMRQDRSPFGRQVIGLVQDGGGRYLPKYDDPFSNLVKSVARGNARLEEGEPVEDRKQTAEESTG